MAERAVQYFLAPALPEARDIREFVPQPGGNKDAASAQLRAVVERYFEALCQAAPAGATVPGTTRAP